jgi:hypothetical protein
MLKKLVTFSIFFTLVTQSIISEVKANTKLRLFDTHQ